MFVTSCEDKSVTATEKTSSSLESLPGGCTKADLPEEALFLQRPGRCVGFSWRET